jgi:hypothetical protein
LVVWTGPVANFQVKGATVPGAKELFLSCYGDKPPHCPTIGTQIAGSPSLLLAKAGLDESELGGLFFGAFSAGGSLIKRVMMNEAYRSLTTSVHLADAMWTASWKDKVARIPLPDEGFVRFGADVATGSGDKLFIATVSPRPNKQWATGVENLRAVKAAIEERTGRLFVSRGDFFGIDPQPDHVYQLGNVIFAEFAEHPLGHGHHAIAGQVWEKIIQPWLAKGKGRLGAPGGLAPPPPAGTEKPRQDPPGDSWWERVTPLGWLSLGVSALGGFWLIRALRRERR